MGVYISLKKGAYEQSCVGSLPVHPTHAEIISTIVFTSNGFTESSLTNLGSVFFKTKTVIKWLLPIETVNKNN